MTAIELKDFVVEKGCEYNRTENNDVILFVDTKDIEEFQKLLNKSNSYFIDDKECASHKKDFYYCFDMNDICGICGIDINKIFEKDD